MYSKKTLIAAALLLGIASAAQAGSRDDPDHGGGFRVGPLGQDFRSGVNPVYHPSLWGPAYAFEPGYLQIPPVNEGYIYRRGY